MMLGFEKHLKFGLSRILPALLTAGLLSACADEEVVYVERPVEEIYNTALDALETRQKKTSMTEVFAEHRDPEPDPKSA